MTIYVVNIGQMGGGNPAHTQLGKNTDKSTNVHLLKCYSGTVNKLLQNNNNNNNNILAIITSSANLR